MEKILPRKRFYSIEEDNEKNRKHMMKKRNFTPDRDSRLDNLNSESNSICLNTNVDYDEKILNNKNRDRIFRESIRKLKSKTIISTINKNPLSDLDNIDIIFENDYSFISTCTKFKHNRVFQEKLKFDFHVTISKYILNQSEVDIFSYVKYRLEGFLDGREFVVDRRYKEFFEYRKLLNRNWPGLFIPPIPPKKDFGNLEDSYIKLRKRHLQQFINRIETAPHLASSHETKIFLESRNKNFNELPFEIYFKTPQCIFTYYKQYFEFLIERNLTKIHKNYINEFYLKLDQTKKYFEEILSNTVQSRNLKLEDYRSCSNFYENFYDFGNDFIYHMSIVDNETRSILNDNLFQCRLSENLHRRIEENTFKTIYDWAFSNLNDIGAMIECISSVYTFQELYEKKFSLLIRENEELIRIANPNFLNSFFFVQDLKFLEAKIFQVESLKDEVLLLKDLVEFLYKIIYYVEIPTFKKDRIKFYKSFICKLIHNESHVYNENIEIFRLLKNHSKNIMKSYSDSPI